MKFVLYNIGNDAQTTTMKKRHSSQNGIPKPLLDLINKFDPTNDLPTPTTLTPSTTRLTPALLNIPPPNLLTMPTKRPHPPLPRLDILEIPLRQPSRNQSMFEPAVMPLAHRLRPAAVKIRGHQPSAKDAFPPSTRSIAALCDEASDCSLFAVGGGFDVAWGRRGELEEEVSGREFQGYEAGRLDVSCDLLDEFGGEGGEVGGIGLADFLISPVRHGGICLFVRLLVMVMAMMMMMLLQRRRRLRLVAPGDLCLPAARLLACSTGQGWTPRVTVSVPGTSGRKKGCLEKIGLVR